MSVLNTVQNGGVGVGVQPKDNPNPAAPPGPTAAAQTDINGIPPGGIPPMGAMPSPSPTPTPAPDPGLSAPPPQPEQTASDKDKQDVDDMLSSLSKNQPKAVKESEDNWKSDIDKQIDNLTKGTIDDKMPIVDPKASALSTLSQQGQMLFAQMRAHLGRDPKEQMAAFQSMYGDDNVKTRGGSLYFRPSPEESFRKVDQTLYNKYVDPILFHALSAVPALAGAAVGAVAGTGAAAATGNPLVGFAAGGSVGAGASDVFNSGLMGAIDSVASKPQEDPDYGAKTQILKDMGFGAATGVILGALGTIPPVKQAVQKLGQYLGSGLSEAEQTAASGGQKIEQLSQVRTAFNEFRSALFPTVADTPAGTGKVIGNAIDKAGETLEKTVGVINSDLIANAAEQGKLVDTSGTRARIKDLLVKEGYRESTTDYGLKLRENLGLPENPNKTSVPIGSLRLGSDVNQATLKSGYKSALEDLAAYYNRLTTEEISGGTTPQQIIKDISMLRSQANFDAGDLSATDVRNLYRQIQNAASVDRNAFASQVYGGSDSSAAKAWKSAYNDYHQKIDAITSFQAKFDTPQSREVLVNSVLQGPAAQKLEMLDGMKQVLGPDSKEWNALRGEVVDNILNARTQEGVLNAKAVFDYVTKPANAELMSRIMSQQEMKVFNKMLIESSKISTSGVMTDSSKRIIEDGIPQMIEMAKSPLDVVRRAYNLFNGNKKAIDYLTDEGFLEAAQKAQGAEARDRILRAMDYMGQARSKMQVVDVPTASAKALAKTTQRYAPFASAAAGSAFDRVVGQGFKPGQAPVPQPAPEPTPAVPPQ